MFNQIPNRNYNINLRLFLNNLYENNNNLLFKTIKNICKDFKIKVDKYDTETLLYILYILGNFQENKFGLKDEYYQILTYLLVKHDKVPIYYRQFNDYLLDANYILNSKIGKVNFSKVPHGIFIEINSAADIKKENLDIKKYITFQDFLEINKCLKKIGFDVDKSFYLQCFHKNFKKWPNVTGSIIYKIYFNFLQENNIEISEIKNYIKGQVSEDIYLSPSHNFIFILFAVELLKKPNFSTFWNLFSELKSKINKYDKERKIPESLIWILASYLNWNEFEEVLKNVYKSLEQKYKKQYLNYAIKYYLEIFEQVNNQKVSYTYSPFVKVWDYLIEKETEFQLEAKYPIFKPSPVSFQVSSSTIYMQINTTEEQFLNYTLDQKIKFLNNFLKNNQFSSFNFNALISVVKADKEKELILKKFKNIINSSEYIELIIGYFESQTLTIQLTDIIKNSGKEDFVKILIIIESIFANTQIVIFFTLFYSSIEHELSKFIKNLHFTYSKNNERNVFINFYKKLKEIFYKNHIKIWNFLDKKILFFKSYKWLYFKLMSLFINPDEIFVTLNVKELIEYKEDFVKYYFDNIELVIFNNWTFKKVYENENELILWMKFLSFIYWNINNWQYSNWKYVPWLLIQKQKLMNEKEKECFFLTLVNTTDESLKLKNILQFGNVFRTQSLTGQEYCKINLFLSYISQEEELDSFLLYIENNLDFYFSNSLSYNAIIAIMDNFYIINISKERKNKISNLLKIVINYFEKNADIENEPFFTPLEIENIKKEEFYYLTEKIIFFILDFHFSDIELIKNEWHHEKKRNIKLLLQYNYSKYLYFHLLKRYIVLEKVKEKIDLINNNY